MEPPGMETYQPLITLPSPEEALQLLADVVTAHACPVPEAIRLLAALETLRRLVYPSAGGPGARPAGGAAS